MVIVTADLIMGLIGGLFIGLSATLFLLGNGRVAGISGIASQVMNYRAFNPVALAFLVGLIMAPFVFGLVVWKLEIVITDNIWLLVVAGFLVGFGARFGSGCTSGHGVCGMSRFSVRSIVATLTFMAVGMLVASVIRTMIGG